MAVPVLLMKPADAGNFVVLEAHCDVLAVLSNCPQMHNPCNGYNPTPISVEVVVDWKEFAG